MSSVASSGMLFAFNVIVAPFVNSMDSILRLISVIGISLTLTVQEALKSLQTAVMTVSPAAFPTTIPFSSTVAAFTLEEDHCTSLLSDVFDGR